jgi:SAM-dependent methyltransferase
VSEITEKAAIIEQARALAPWHFDIEIFPGVRTKQLNQSTYENKDLAHVAMVHPVELKTMLTLAGIKGRTFLDVGCNGGGYCFLAHELGATACFGFDIREHWIKQAEFIKAVKYGAAESIQFAVADAKTFAPSARYDVTLFKGIFYHLPDPITTLRSICDLTERVMVVDTATKSNIHGTCLVPWRESVTHVMSGVDGLAWLPGGPEVVNAILAWAGFPYTRVPYHKKGGEAERFRGRLRLVAARHEGDLAAYDAHFAKK